MATADEAEPHQAADMLDQDEEDDALLSQRSDVPISQQTCSSEELTCVGCCGSSKVSECPVECLKSGGTIVIEKAEKAGVSRIVVQNKRGVKGLRLKWGKMKKKTVKTRGGKEKKKKCKAGVWCLNCMALYNNRFKKSYPDIENFKALLNKTDSKERKMWDNCIEEWLRRRAGLKSSFSTSTKITSGASTKFAILDPQMKLYSVAKYSGRKGGGRGRRWGELGVAGPGPPSKNASCPKTPSPLWIKSPRFGRFWEI